ncbi:MAG: DivIVA domain-containing protein [Rhodoglobus sp.]
MALTPEDVVNKRFQPTKFREGYDQDEVDDFLDEVVVELRRLNQENEELRQRLVAGDSRIAELQRGAVQAPPASNNFAQEPAPFIAPAPVPVPVPVAEPTPAYAAPQAAAPVDDSLEPSSANNLLQLARRLHEEHVREGIEKRDALIAEGHSTAARIVGEAESRQRAQLEILEKERVQLGSRVDELRTFEREYRVNLKGYIESQLRELDTSGGLTAPAAESAASTPVAEPEAETAAERPFGDKPYTPQYTPQYSPTSTEAPVAFPEPPSAPATEQRPAQNFPGGFGGN